MRRLEKSAAVVIALLSATVTAAVAQTRPPVAVPAVLIAPVNPVVVRPADPTAVVDRLLSFDADGDRRVTVDELPERMQALFAGVDANGDGFVTGVEAAAAAVDRRRAFAGSQTLPLRAVKPSLAEVVADLKLPQATHDRAMALVRRYQAPRNVNDPDGIDAPTLHAAMWTLLGEEDYENFAAAANRAGVRP